MQKDLRMYYLTTARIPGEKAHSLQTIKNVDALMSENFDVRLLAAKRKNDFKVVKSIKNHFHLKNELIIEYVASFSNLNIKKIQGIMFLLLNFSFAIFAFLKIINDNTDKQKIIFLRDTALLKPISYLLKLKKIPLIFELHDLPKRDRTAKYNLYKKCNLVFTTSDYQKNILIKNEIDENKIATLKNGFDSELFENIQTLEPGLKTRFGLKKDTTIVMYAGSLASWKEVDFILKSADFTSTDIIYVIVGGNDIEINRLKENFSNHINRIKFTGFVPHKSIPAYLNEADILVHYTNPSGGELGSFSPIKLFEYMAAGKPILSVSLPWIKEIIIEKRNGLTYDPESPKDLAKKITLLQKNEPLQYDLGKNAKHDIAQFSYSNRAKNMIKQINEKIRS